MAPETRTWEAPDWQTAVERVRELARDRWPADEWYTEVTLWEDEDYRIEAEHGRLSLDETHQLAERIVYKRSEAALRIGEVVVVGPNDDHRPATKEERQKLVQSESGSGPESPAPQTRG